MAQSWWADVDGDDDIDLAVSDFSGDISIYENDGDAGFTSATWVEVDSSGYNFYFAAGDFDEDGVVDLVSSNFAAGTLTVFLGE